MHARESSASLIQRKTFDAVLPQLNLHAGAPFIL
jgi:hypothetical protein